MTKDSQILIRVSQKQYKEFKEFAEEFTEGNMSRAFRRCFEIVMERERNQDDPHQDFGPLKSSLDGLFELIDIHDRKLSAMSIKGDSNGIDPLVLEAARAILDRLAEGEDPTFSTLFGEFEYEPRVMEGAVSLLGALGWKIRRDDPNDYKGGGEADDKKFKG